MISFKRSQQPYELDTISTPFYRNYNKLGSKSLLLDIKQMPKIMQLLKGKCGSQTCVKVTPATCIPDEKRSQSL